MADLTSNERNHALDATRAFALLLGVVFHAVWSFVPYDFGAPVVDRSANQFFGWFFYTSHIFRMPLFFLIAGFFGRLVYQGRGCQGFAIHRLKRIAIPFVVGWLILFPLVIMTWVWGGNITGRNLTPVPISDLILAMYRGGLLLRSQNQGGFFGTAHLWFLYYLLWIYLLAVVGRALLVKSPRLRDLADRLTSHVMTSPWATVWLSLFSGTFLYWMNGWMGVDTPTSTLVPSFQPLLLYGSFLVLGWLLHRQANLLRTLGQRWKWQLPLALLLTVPLYVAFLQLMETGAANRIYRSYPQLTATQIVDWPGLLENLQSAESSEESSKLRAVWEAILPESSRIAIANMSDDASIDQQAGVCVALNRVLSVSGLFADTTNSGSQEQSNSSSSADSTSIESTMLANRSQLDALLGDTLTSDPRGSWYAPTKFIYSYAYALVMWLFVFGTLGAFQDLCKTHSPSWRYVADSSYWVYLVHLPIVPFLQVWMADWPLPSVVKFMLLIAISSILLFGSYHYLVRSTIIGQVLNGRRYPK